jgi:FkbM family methyltransferase
VNRLLLDPKDLYQSMMLLRCFDADVDYILTKALTRGDVYVDVGAQLGYTASIAIEMVGENGTVLLFEPDKRVIPHLNANLAQSIARGYAKLETNACSDGRESELKLCLFDTYGFSRIGNRTDSDVANSEYVSAVRLDDKLCANGIHSVRVLKIDVEGYELSVLKGLHKYLKSKRIDVICIEKNIGLLEQNGVRPIDLHLLLSNYGYLGCHTDGVSVSIADFNAVPLENLAYFSTPTYYRMVFGRSYSDT